MKNKYVLLLSISLGIYSTLALIFYIMKLFPKGSNVFYFASYDFESLFLILLLHFIYWVGTIAYFFKKKYLNNLLITLGAIGFLISGLADYILVSTYDIIFYLVYLGIHIVILIALGGSLYKILKISLSFILLWTAIITLAYNFLHSLLII